VPVGWIVRCCKSMDMTSHAGFAVRPTSCPTFGLESNSLPAFCCSSRAPTTSGLPPPRRFCQSRTHSGPFRRSTRPISPVSLSARGIRGPAPAAFVGELSGAVMAGSMQPAQYSFTGLYQFRWSPDSRPRCSSTHAPPTRRAPTSSRSTSVRCRPTACGTHRAVSPSTAGTFRGACSGDRHAVQHAARIRRATLRELSPSGQGRRDSGAGERCARGRAQRPSGARRARR